VGHLDLYTNTAMAKLKRLVSLGRRATLGDKRPGADFVCCRTLLGNLFLRRTKKTTI